MDLLSIKKIKTKNTILSVIEKLPFTVKRVYFMQGMSMKEQRGNHSHLKNRQFMVCVQGSCRIMLENNYEFKNFILETNKGLMIEPYSWHSMTDFSRDCILLVLASEEYDEKDYVRNYEQFKKTVYFNTD